MDFVNGSGVGGLLPGYMALFAVRRLFKRSLRSLRRIVGSGRPGARFVRPCTVAFRDRGCFACDKPDHQIVDWPAALGGERGRAQEAG